MFKVRKLAMIGGTVICAAAIGYVVQMGDSVPEAPDPVAKADFTPLSQPASVSEEPIEMVMASLDEPLDMPTLPADPIIKTVDCSVTADAETKAGAMVALSISAPCAPNARVAIHHNGLMFADTTDMVGQLDLEIPALAVNAVFIVEMGSGEGAVATAEVPSLIFYDRVALQWADDSGFEVHAREFGADYGDSGHVWQEVPRDPTAAALGDGGFLNLLGDADTLAPRMAQIYTFPSAAASREGIIAISVEAEVTEVNCGRSIAAQSLELRNGGTLRTRDLSLSVPDCDAAGSFLVLNNLMDDLKIAAK